MTFNWHPDESIPKNLLIVIMYFDRILCCYLILFLFNPKDKLTSKLASKVASLGKTIHNIL